MSPRRQGRRHPVRHLRSLPRAPQPDQRRRSRELVAQGGCSKCAYRPRVEGDYLCAPCRESRDAEYAEAKELRRISREIDEWRRSPSAPTSPPRGLRHQPLALAQAAGGDGGVLVPQSGSASGNSIPSGTPIGASIAADHTGQRHRTRRVAQGPVGSEDLPLLSHRRRTHESPIDRSPPLHDRRPARLRPRRLPALQARHQRRRSARLAAGVVEYPQRDDNGKAVALVNELQPCPWTLCPRRTAFSSCSS